MLLKHSLSSYFPVNGQNVSDFLRQGGVFVPSSSLIFYQGSKFLISNQIDCHGQAKFSTDAVFMMAVPQQCSKQTASPTS